MTSSDAGVRSSWLGRVRPIQAVVVLAVFVTLCALGSWQMRRLAWKTRLLRQIAALQAAPAEPLEVVLNRLRDGGEVDYVRVQALCPSLQQTPMLRLYAILDGVMGERRITVCPVASSPYRSILVDRGFVAHERVGEVGVGPVLETPITGVLRRADPAGWLAPPNRPQANDWRNRDIAAMARALNAPAPAPVFLMLERPSPTGFGPTPAPVPTRIPNNHLGYALTWFGLAVALLGVWIAALRQPGRR